MKKIKNVSEQSRNGPDLGIEMYLLGHVYLGFIFTCGGTQWEYIINNPTQPLQQFQKQNTRWKTTRSHPTFATWVSKSQCTGLNGWRFPITHHFGFRCDLCRGCRNHTLMGSLPTAPTRRCCRSNRMRKLLSPRTCCKCRMRCLQASQTCKISYCFVWIYDLIYPFCLQ